MNENDDINSSTRLKFTENEINQFYSSSYNCAIKQVPVVKITKTTTIISLAKKEKRKGKEGKYNDIMARGQLRGWGNMEFDLRGIIDFRGNFKGSFEEVESRQSPYVRYYFQGEITQLIIISINGKVPPEEMKLELSDHAIFKGYFYGIFFPASYIDVATRHMPKHWNMMEKIMKTKKNIDYHIPALARLDIRQINKIQLSKSSAVIAGILHIDIQLNKQVLSLIYDIQNMRFTKKRTLTVDFHRGKPIELPFYDVEDEEEEEADSDDEWGDGAQGETLWNRKKMRMSYQINMEFTAEIDNSHGIFYAPFNLNILRIVVDFHSIKIDKKTKICFNCCDMTDFNLNCDYTPYTYFQNLKPNFNLKTTDSFNQPSIYQKHIDRLTKIDFSQFRDQGEYKIASNRLSLFPYHHRVLKNRNTITSEVKWTLGTASRTALLQNLTVRSISQGYDLSLQQKQVKVFEIQRWEFVHIEMPIFKYLVIDMIRIFVPIILLSTMGMAIFSQENCIGSGGFTLLAQRICVSTSIMISYVALVPMIRANLPPTPSVTLVQILIYLSVIPNLIAIIDVFLCGSTDFSIYFATYNPFVDGFFMSSFLIWWISFLALAIMMVVYARKDYMSDFTIRKFKPSSFKNLRAPVFLEYIEQIKEKRKNDIRIEQLPIPYFQIENFFDD